METGEIRLEGGGFNGWLEQQEQRITKARDALSLMESQAGRLSGVWESGAGKLWESALRENLRAVEECVLRMERLLLKTLESARGLVTTERKLIARAQEL